MSDKAWWIIMSGWTFCFLVLFVWMYRTVKTSDEVMETSDIDWDAFFQESCEQLAQRALEPDYAYRERMKVLRPDIKLHRVTELPQPMSPTWPREDNEPFHLDDDSQPLAS